MDQKTDYEPAWLARVRAMRSEEVLKILPHEAKPDTIRKWLSKVEAEGHGVRHKIRIRDHCTFVGLTQWPNLKCRARGSQDHLPRHPSGRRGDAGFDLGD